MKPNYAAAREYARERIGEFAKTDSFGLGIPALHRDAGKLMAQRAFKTLAASGSDGMSSIINYAAAGWDEADRAVRDLAAEIANRGEALPSALNDYMNASRDRLPAPRGPKKSTNAIQDMLLGGLLSELVEQFGVKPTRRTARHNDSACDIVVAAVNEAKIGRLIEYKQAEHLWLLWGRHMLSDAARAAGNY